METPQNAISPNGVINTKKKNRTLQFYKFLFYSLKAEIKAHEFINIIRITIIFEIVLWAIIFTLNIISSDFPNVYEYGNKVNFSNGFVYPQFSHVIRGITGMIIYCRFPKSYDPIETIKKVDDTKLENIFFNDLAREIINDTIIDPIKKQNLCLFIYLGLTIFNIVIDLISFISFSLILHKSNESYKVILFTYVLVDIVLLIVDLKYVFWTKTLQYSFPHKFFDPISELFYGFISKLKSKFKIDKKKTNVEVEMKKVEDVIKENNTPSEYQSNFPANKDNINNNIKIVI